MISFDYLNKFLKVIGQILYFVELMIVYLT